MNLSQIRQDAAQRLREDEGSFSRLVLIHTAITAGLSLVLMLVSWLTQNISTEGGLSNLDTQSMLSTGQILLQMISIIATPFWEAGLIYCALQFLRNRHNTTGDLTEGFRRLGPITSSLVIRSVIYFGVSMGCYFASSIFLSILPLPASLVKEVTAFTEAPAFPLSNGVRTFMIIYGLIYIASLCILLVPRLYLHRLVVYRIMDNEPCGGLQSVLHSRILMKGHRKQLFLLDLSFWWFYLLELGIGFLSMGNLFFQLPISAEAAAWVFPVTALLARLALYWFAKPKLAISYALFYQGIYEESLKEPEAPQPKQMPWNY